MANISIYSEKTIEFLFALNPEISFEDINKIRTISGLDSISEISYADLQNKHFGLVDGIKIMLTNDLNNTKSINKIKKFVNKNRNNNDINFEGFNEEEKNIMSNFFAINRKRKSIGLSIFTWGKYTDYIAKQGFHIMEALSDS